MPEIKTIGVVGAGTMGHGIAQVCAQAGFRTLLFDINAAALSQAQTDITQNLETSRQKGKLTEAQVKNTLANLTFTQDTLDLLVDLVIEAVVEKLEVKQGIFKELTAINPPSCILATNTSSFSITRLAAGLENPERFIGMHFFNPAPLMPLVEVVAGAATAAETMQTVTDLVWQLNKIPVPLQDSPGFIVNRVARHYYLESLKLLEEQVADHQTIDKLLEATGFKMGPFRLMDLIGNDVNLAVTASLFKAFNYEARFRPNRIQEQKVDAGHLGRKTGKGFYDYS
ncbi:3-hydroxyacyl-CoA dehydrogenase family protein [Adhaeribacter rhizoryzae]|uniref:3-hydroxybutyryl-CoA dehydrogenase n=1 Tax=Adhaeribacter rhizoryzae TaxID=2607907 RepID=A0A5M6D7C5_9BACT|nr:3-hydroxyacyl-CoA dehydrogenase NAD-binding domain-containing protein [Adhaeribacter rhizoryzae]KAA5543407.1 3-hydroxybutyryl-CoA dehydrogenase [Adhaeribacter rhizoryzae]